MGLALFTSRNSRRLTPHPPERAWTLAAFWGVAAMTVYAVPAAANGSFAMACALLSLPVLLGGFRRTLWVGVFVTDTALLMHDGRRLRTIAFEQVAALTLRPVGGPHQTLWVDLIDGSRYPSPARLGGTTGDPLALPLSRDQMSTLIAMLSLRLPQHTRVPSLPLP